MLAGTEDETEVEERAVRGLNAEEEVTREREARPADCCILPNNILRVG